MLLRSFYCSNDGTNLQYYIEIPVKSFQCKLSPSPTVKKLHFKNSDDFLWSKMVKAPVKMIEKWEQNNGELEPDIKSEFLRSGNLLYFDVWQHLCL